MSICPNVTQEELINLRKVAEDQRTQRALEIKITYIKQTHDINSSENLSAITKKLEVNKCKQKLGDLMKESNSENENNQELDPVEIESEDENIQTSIRVLPNSKIFFTVMTETLGAFMNSKNSLKLKQDGSDRAPTFENLIYTFGGGRIKLNENNEEEVEEVKKEKMRQKFISAVKRDPTKVFKEVYENVLESNPADPCPKYFSVKPTLCHERSRHVPQVSTSAGTLMITGRWARTLTDSQFLLKNDRSSGIVVFAIEQFFLLLAETAIISTDATFKANPCPFEQLYDIFGTF